MPDLSVQYLCSPVLASLDPEDLEYLVRVAIQRDYRKGQMVALTGEAWPYLFLVQQGKVAAIKESVEGRLLMVSVFDPGKIFWGLTFFDAQALMPVTLQAVEKSHICLWTRSLLLPLIQKNGRFSWALSLQMAKMMQHASEIVENLAFNPITCRLARFLLNKYEATSGTKMARDLTLDEIAAHIGTTREVVCRVLSRFSEEGVIEVQRTEFTFTNLKKLEEYAREAPDAQPCNQLYT